MKKNIFLIFCVINLSVYSQQIVPSLLSTAGDFFSNSTISISWSLGELAIETLVNEQNIITQGFQQTRLVINSTEDIAQNFDLKIYPNPSSDFLFIENNTAEKYNYQIEVFNILGEKQLLQQAETKATKYKLDVHTLRPGVYFLNLLQDTGTKTIMFQKIE